MSLFVNVTEDGSQYLTAAGYVLTIALFAAVLILAAYAAKKAHGAREGEKGMGAREIAFCAMSIALATLLSMIKLYEFPFGGSVTAFSMLFICLPGYFYGLTTGLLAATAYGILQFLLGPYVLFPIQVLVDYPLAFGALGLAGIFASSDRHGLTKGYILGIFGRYFFAVISGWIFFGEYAWEGWAALPYSLAYNAAYIFAEGIVTIVLLQIPAVAKGLERVKREARG